MASAGTVALPPGACDTHLHFYGAGSAIAPAAHLRPPDANVAGYRNVQRQLGLERLVVVQPTTYGLDNRCQLQAMAEFGDSARGVMVVDHTTSGEELRRLTTLGVRGARFHMLAGGALPWSELEPVADRIAPLGWHVQLQLDGRELPGRLDQVLALPTEVVIDHVGRFMPPVDVGHDAFRALLRLIDSGRVWVKVSAPYESSESGPPQYADVAPLVQALVQHAPERLLWATNWPHPGQEQPPTPDALADELVRWLPTAMLRQQVLVDNPARLYGF